MIEIKMPDGKIVEMEQAIYDKIAEIILTSEFVGMWINYTDVFPTLKPRVVDAVGAGVWKFMAVIRGLEAAGKMEISETEQGDMMLFIEEV